MQWKTPKNTDKYQWTAHVTEKMHYYGLSEQKVLGVIRRPQRIETCVVENTVAVMVPVGNISKIDSKPSKWKMSFTNEENKDDKWNQEIWVMYQVSSQKSKYSKQQKLEDEDTAKADKKIDKFKNKIKDPKLRALQDKINSNKKITIISAWRYPGVSPKNNPIPEDIIREIEETL
ncbi:MAG: hypothetical protein ACD_5C00289G0005 [uncultured bacterium]|nr:MAG: hypothetical protein ACD_5C00289G0005 [uncultured bacterium]